MLHYPPSLCTKRYSYITAISIKPTRPPCKLPPHGFHSSLFGDASLQIWWERFHALCVHPWKPWNWPSLGPGDCGSKCCGFHWARQHVRRTRFFHQRVLTKWIVYMATTRNTFLRRIPSAMVFLLRLMGNPISLFPLGNLLIGFWQMFLFPPLSWGSFLRRLFGRNSFPIDFWLIWCVSYLAIKSVFRQDHRMIIFTCMSRSYFHLHIPPYNFHLIDSFPGQ
jgi:hypothetical protein